MAAVNDATKQKIGDIYQYFIALFDCFSLKKGESMLIETEGDVSIVSHSGQNRVQKEIKHHLGKRNLSDRDEDYWNTLDNWCKNKHSTATFEKLIFTPPPAFQRIPLFTIGTQRIQTRGIACSKTAAKKGASGNPAFGNIMTTYSLQTH